MMTIQKLKNTFDDMKHFLELDTSLNKVCFSNVLGLL